MKNRHGFFLVYNPEGKPLEEEDFTENFASFRNEKHVFFWKRERWKKNTNLRKIDRYGRAFKRIVKAQIKR